MIAIGNNARRQQWATDSIAACHRSTWTLFLARSRVYEFGSTTDAMDAASEIEASGVRCAVRSTERQVVVRHPTT